MTTTLARTLNQGLDLCDTSCEEAGLLMPKEVWSSGAVLAIVCPVIGEAQPQLIDLNYDDYMTL